LAGVRLAESDQAFERRRLAGAVRAEQAEDLALPDLEAHAPDRFRVAVTFLQIADDDFWHGGDR
jgi:hypothetical protein